jgi:hypothetical protein
MEMGGRLGGREEGREGGRGGREGGRERGREGGKEGGREGYHCHGFNLLSEQSFGLVVISSSPFHSNVPQKRLYVSRG